jgi:hypothetical protein
LTTPELQTSTPDDRRWVKTLRDSVPPTTFKKGREAAEAGKVSQLAREGARIISKVQGSTGAGYDVWVELETEPIASHCSCEAWNKYGPHCKHVVALALTEYARQRAKEREELPAPPPADVVPLPALAKLESWLGLSSLPDLEFLYRVAPAHNAHGHRAWLLDVRRKDAQAQGPVQVKRLLAQGGRIAPVDERIFMELAKHESRYDARIVLSDEDLCDLVDLLKQRKVIYRGTALVFSEEPARPQVHLESTPDGGASAVLEFRLPNEQTATLKDGLLLIGRRTGVIVGQTLYPVSPDLPPRLWRKWQLEPRMSFPPAQLDRTLTFFAAHLPRYDLGFKADGLDVDDNVEPKFLLTIEGTLEKARAKLAARYGNTTVPVSPTAMHLGYAAAAGEGKKLYRRNEISERAAGKVLLEKGFKYDSTQQSYEAQGDAALEFWARGLSELPADWERYGAQAPKVRLRPKLKPKVKVSMSGVNWFELESEFVTDDQAVDLGAGRMWLDSGRKFIPLKDGTFAEADAAELKRAADLLEEAGAAPGRAKTRLPLYQSVALELLGALGDAAEIETKARNAMRALRDAEGFPSVDAPKGLQATLRHYQESGLSWLWFHNRHALSGILADDMGLGKTIQALALLQKAREEIGPMPSLVVAPTSVLANWEREAERFTPSLKVLVWHGADRKEYAETLAHSDLVLTSYALVRRDLEALQKVEFRYVILDEAQNIKNADSATAQASKSLKSELRLALTGTPLENRLSELWSIFDFLMPGFLGSADTFAERYEQPIQLIGDPDSRDRLRRRIQPFILRRLKTEVAKDLPPKTETVAYCEMEPGQAALYREVLEESKRKVYDSIEKVGFKRSRVSILAALMRLRQVCCDPRLLKMPPGTLLPGSSKLQRFTELCDDLVAEGHRALVFSQFTEMLELLKQEADGKKLGYMYLDGRTKDRMSRVDQFNDPNGPPLFFISLKAGGTGLNLTAADYVIHYDPWWNPAVEDQATDRTHRIGQTKAVISYKLITRGTVEEKILALQKRKRELAAGVLGGEADFGQILTENDVEELFNGGEL